VAAEPIQVDILRENDNFIEALQTATDRADFSLDHLPSLLTTVINENRWQRRHVRSMQKVVSFSSFIEFVTAKTPAGLGASVAMLMRMCGDDENALKALDGAVRGQHGGDRKSTEAQIKRVIHPLDLGRSGKYRRRLAADFPALYRAVLAGEKTVNGAAIEAGIYPKRTSINLNDPASAAQTIARHFDRDQVSELIACLYEEMAERRP